MRGLLLLTQPTHFQPSTGYCWYCNKRVQHSCQRGSFDATFSYSLLRLIYEEKPWPEFNVVFLGCLTFVVPGRSQPDQPDSNRLFFPQAQVMQNTLLLAKKFNAVNLGSQLFILYKLLNILMQTKT